MDYARYRDIAKRVIPKWGTAGTLLQTRAVIPDPQKPWNATSTDTTIDIKLVIFPDDGVTFVDHNLTGDVRIALVAPTDALTSVEIGDKVSYSAASGIVKNYTKLDPDGTGAILWALLIV